MELEHAPQVKIGVEAPSKHLPKCDAVWLADRIQILLSAYRRDDYADPAGFLVQLGAVLEQYPEWVVRRVTDPATGIQRTSTFPPSIAEVVSACEELYGPVRRNEEWDARARAQIEARQALPRPVRYSAQTITYRDAEEMMKARKLRIVGVFDGDRTTNYRG